MRNSKGLIALLQKNEATVRANLEELRQFIEQPEVKERYALYCRQREEQAREKVRQQEEERQRQKQEALRQQEAERERSVSWSAKASRKTVA